jgi:ribonuclease-3
VSLNHRSRRKDKIFASTKEFRSDLRNILGFHPRKSAIYKNALIHKSATNENADGTGINNERLEYLGDAILDAVLSEYLFSRFPEAPEGQLTKLRARLVNRNTLNRLALAMKIDRLLISHLPDKCSSKNIYGDALEAIIGALFLDKGYRRTKNFIIKNILSNHIDLRNVINTETDYKSQVFQWAQKMKRQITFNYTEDYDFNEKKHVFTTVLTIDNEIFGEGTASSKKEAEQRASLEALGKISNSDPVS